MRSKAHTPIEAVGSGPYITPQTSKQEKKRKPKENSPCESAPANPSRSFSFVKSRSCGRKDGITHTHFRDLVIYGWVVQQVGMAAAVWR